MENNELKKVSVKNHTCFYFDDIIKLQGFDLHNILIDKKSHENILIYDISYQTSICLKHLQIKFDKINGIIKIYNKTRYLTLLDTEKYDTVYKKIRYLISLKGGITYTIFHNFGIMKVDSLDSLPIEKYYFCIML